MKVLIIFLAILLALLEYQLLFTKNGLVATYHLQKITKAQVAKNALLKQQNDNMLLEIAELKKGGSALLERARNELGMVEKGETFYQVITKKE